MTQFAQFDSTISAPSPVIGWYDTTALTYPSLPNPADLLAITPAQWAERMTGQWAVSGGALVAYVSPAPTPTLAQSAALASVSGLTISLTGSVTLAATLFPTDAVTQGKIAAMNAMAMTGALPTGFTTYDMRDASGGWHHFTAAQYQAVAHAIAAYVAVLSLIADGNPNAPTSLPASSVTLTV